MVISGTEIAIADDARKMGTLGGSARLARVFGAGADSCTFQFRG